jgi:hypothetical protein
MSPKSEANSSLVAALKRGGYNCTLMQAVEPLGEDERQAVAVAVDNIRVSTQKRDWRKTGYTVNWLVTILCEHGIAVTYRQVERHVKKQCLCGA